MNWDEQFEQIVGNIDPSSLKDPRYEKLTPEEVSRAVVGMNETATYLGRYLLQCMMEDENNIPEEVSIFVREMVVLTDTISTILSSCNCPDCTGEYDDDDEE